MTECSLYQELISRMLDGDLSESENERLHAHISECADCRRVLDAFTMLRDSMAEDLEEPPAGFADAVMEQVRHEPVSIAKKRRLPVARYLALAACLAIVVFAASRFDLFKGKGAQMASDAAQAPQLTENKVMIAGDASTSAALANVLTDTEETESEAFFDVAAAAEESADVPAEEPQPTAAPDLYASNEPAAPAAPQTLEYEGQTYYLKAQVDALPRRDESAPQAVAAQSEKGTDAQPTRSEDTDGSQKPVCIDGLLYLQLAEELWAVYALP